MTDLPGIRITGVTVSLLDLEMDSERFSKRQAKKNRKIMVT